MSFVIQTIGIFTLSLLLNIPVYAHSAQAYLEKFLTYTAWVNNLPRTPDPAFLNFIEQPSPLTRKLREKWLYQLAYNKEWETFSQYYTGSNDTNLQCYALTALYHQNKHQQVQEGLPSLWLNGLSLPIACDHLFTDLLKSNSISNDLIQQRIALALQQNNVSLARYLLKQLKPARIQDADLLTTIYQNPKNITHIPPGFMHGEFYLYGLQRMIQHHMDDAIKLFKTPQAQQLMTENLKQRFLADISLYKAIRDQPDTNDWFKQVKPAFYNDALLEWQIRYSLIHHQWKNIVALINQSTNKDEPCNQYWLARALNELGDKEQAVNIYNKLAEKRNYYGFLASIKLKKSPRFENESTPNNPQRLLPYKPITDQIKTLHASQRMVEASRLLNDFISELPKEDKSTLARWIANDLHWFGKSIYLSNNDELNNQLALRFPLAHHELVEANAKQHQIPKELIFAVIRQESSFNEDIVSPAGASGLMQIMHGTANAIAKRAHIAYSNKKQLFSPQKNISIGTAYLNQLAMQYHHHPILMMSAYNAGPKQTNYWVKNHVPKEMDIWIETLPWRETRNYLKNIVSFYAVYQYRMHEKLSLNAFMQPF